MARDRTSGDRSALVAVLEHLRAQDVHLRAQDKGLDDFRREVRESLRSHRAESQDFREEMRARVGGIETKLAAEDAADAAVEKQRSSWGAVAAWAFGALLAIAGILIPLLWGKL